MTTTMHEMLILPSILVLALCSSSTVASKAEHKEAQQLALDKAIAATPYSAVVQHTRVEVLAVTDDPTLSEHVYYADVIDPLRGEPASRIKYRMYVEQDEDAIVERTPVIITLCNDSDGYYWPGVGSQFNATKGLLQRAKDINKELDAKQTHFAHCDQ